jgi:hypothetical protein
MLGKLGHLIPGLDNTILKQILTQGRGDLPPLFNQTSNSLIRKLVPSKIRLLIDQVSRIDALLFSSKEIFSILSRLSMPQNRIWPSFVNC